MASYQSTFIDVVNSVIKKLRLDAVLDLDKAKDWTNQSYSQVAAETRFLATSGTAQMAEGDASYMMPAGILHIEELTLTDGGNQVYPPLVQKNIDFILRCRRIISAVGPPRYYTLVGINQLEFWPKARGSDVLTFWYSYLPEALVNDGDVSELVEPFGSKLLEYGALVQGAEFLKDPLLSDFQGMYASWLAAYQRYVNRRAGNYPQSFQVYQGDSYYIPNDRSSDWNLTGYGWPQ